MLARSYFMHHVHINHLTFELLAKSDNHWGIDDITQAAAVELCPGLVSDKRNTILTLLWTPFRYTSQIHKRTVQFVFYSRLNCRYIETRCSCSALRGPSTLPCSHVQFDKISLNSNLACQVASHLQSLSKYVTFCASANSTLFPVVLLSVEEGWCQWLRTKCDTTSREPKSLCLFPLTVIEGQAITMIRLTGRVQNLNWQSVKSLSLRNLGLNAGTIQWT